MQKKDELRNFYEELVSKHQDELYRFAYRYCGRADIAEDLAAETFGEAWKSLPGLRSRNSARAWIFQIMRYRCFHWLREKKLKPKLIPASDEIAQRVRAKENSPLEDMARQEGLQRALDAMEDRYKEPFLLAFMQGLSCKDIAKEMNIPLGTVLSRIHRAREFLRRLLSDFAADFSLKSRTEENLSRGGINIHEGGRS